MENPKASLLFGRNIFAEAFAQFDEEAFFNDLHHQVRNKPYFEKYKGFKTTLLWLSYLFNLVSAATACYAVYWLIERVSGANSYGFSVIGLAVAALFLFFFEKLKRKSSTEFWQVFFFHRKIAVGWLALSACLLGLSVISSTFGTYEGVENLAPDPELIAADSLAMEYRHRVARLEEENTTLSQQRNEQGIIYYHVQSAIKNNKQMIADYSVRILELDQKLEGKNELLSAQYAADIKLTAWTLILVTIIMELLFEACIAYIWYYYYRSYVERRQVGGIAADAGQDPSPALAARSLPQEVDTLALLQQVQAQLTALQRAQSLPHQTNHEEKNTASPPLSNQARIIVGGFMPPYAQENPLQPIATDRNAASPSPFYEDYFTILHHRFSDGKPVRYGRDRVDWYVKHYREKLAEAQQAGQGEALENFRSKLAYWQSRQQELYAKLAKAPEGLK